MSEHNLFETRPELLYLGETRDHVAQWNAAVIALHFPLNNFTSPQEPVLLLIFPLIIYCNYCHLLSNSLTLNLVHWVPASKSPTPRPSHPASKLPFCRPRITQPHYQLLQDELVLLILDHLFGHFWPGLTAHQPSPCHYPRRRGRRPRQ